MEARVTSYLQRFVQVHAAQDDLHEAKYGLLGRVEENIGIEHLA